MGLILYRVNVELSYFGYYAIPKFIVAEFAVAFPLSAALRHNISSPFAEENDLIDKSS
jgi:hypothetical protein